MRTLKFRMWCDSLKVMYTPDNQIGHLWSIPESPNGILTPKEGDTLMLYTGVFDKHDNEVCAGDIVQLKNVLLLSQEYDFPNDEPKEEWGDLIAEVEYNKGMFCVWNDATDCYMPIYMNKESIEIIGNVFEHEYLLRDGN